MVVIASLPATRCKSGAKFPLAKLKIASFLELKCQSGTLIKMKYLVLLLFFSISAFAQTLPPPMPPPPSIVPNVTAQVPRNKKTLEQRLLDVENQQREFEQWYSDYYLQSKGRISPFLGEKISLGGFYETAITQLSGPDTPDQLVASSNVLGINIAAEFNEKIRFVAQYLTALTYTLQNPHNNPALTPSIREYGAPYAGSLVAHAYVEYRDTEALILQTGIGYVPFGTAFGQREPTLLKRRGGPQMLEAGDGDSVGIAFPLWMGLHAQGSFILDKGRMGYDLYTFSPTGSRKMGVGGRTWWSNSNNFTIGLSAQTSVLKNGSYYSYGTDANFKLEDFGLIVEYARNLTSGSPAIVSYYLEPYYQLSQDEWLIYAVADYIDQPNHTVGAVVDGYEKWLWGLGVNWLPMPNVRLRLAAFSHDYVKDSDSISGQYRDYCTLDFSGAIAF